MDARLEQQVRERAYQIWIEAGMMQGLEHEHWIAAERDIIAKSSAAPTISKRATASKSKPVVAKPVSEKAAVAKVVSAKPVATKAAKAPEAKLAAVKAKTTKSAKTAMSDARGSLN